MIVNAKDSTVYIRDNHLHKVEFSTDTTTRTYTRMNVNRNANRYRINRAWRNSMTRQAGMGAQSRVGTIDIQGQQFIGDIMDKLVALERENARLLCESLMEQNQKHTEHAARERARDLEIMKKDSVEKAKTFTESQKSKDGLVKVLMSMVMVLTFMNIALALKI